MPKILEHPTHKEKSSSVNSSYISLSASFFSLRLMDLGRHSINDVLGLVDQEARASRIVFKSWSISVLGSWSYPANNHLKGSWEGCLLSRGYVSFPHDLPFLYRAELVASFIHNWLKLMEITCLITS